MIKNTLVIAEVKTTLRAEKNNLGGEQWRSIKEDIDRLKRKDAEHRYLFIIDKKNEAAIRALENSRIKKIEIINLFDET